MSEQKCRKVYGVRTNSMRNNILHECKCCLDMWTIVLEMLL